MSPALVAVLTSVSASIIILILQKNIDNVLSGINLWLTKPFKKGDKIIVKFNSYEVTSGKVLSLGLAHTKIKAYNQDVCILSNSYLNSCAIVNSDYKQGMNYTEHVRISYTSNLGKAIEIIKSVLITSQETINTAKNTDIICKNNDGNLLLQYNVRTTSVDQSYSACSNIMIELITKFNSESDIELV